MNADFVKVLRELQFTEYEAKAYLALLEKAPLTGYGVALHSGVPRSKIYEVLGGMAQRGDVVVSQEETPLYRALAPRELVRRRRRRAEEAFAEAESALEGYAASTRGSESIWSVAGREAILDRVREIAGAARQRLLLELWREDAAELAEALAGAAGRGVEVHIVAYGAIEFPFAHVYPHGSSDRITRLFGGRWIVCSRDDREVVAGIVSLGEDSRAAWTTHPGLVMPITEVVIHDLYIHEMLKAFRPQLEERFGPDMDLLRKQFTIAPNGKQYYTLQKGELE